MNNAVTKLQRKLSLILWRMYNIRLRHKIRNTWIKPAVPRISTIIFSKDRVMQLDLLLNSFFATSVGMCEVSVIFFASSDDHREAYEQLKEIYKDRVRFVEQNQYDGFKECLLATLRMIIGGKIFFLVDDIVFTEEVNYEKLAEINLSKSIFSLRMGKNLNYSYVVAKEQNLPKSLTSVNSKFLKWQWSEGELDWSYPLSVDGHLFNIKEVLLWAQYLDFKSPSSFEIALQKLKSIYIKKDGLAYHKSRIVNIPANKVQTEVDNFHGDAHQDDLLHKWLGGLRINHDIFMGWDNSSVHEEAEFSYINRPKLSP